MSLKCYYLSLAQEFESIEKCSLAEMSQFWHCDSHYSQGAKQKPKCDA